MIYRHVDIQTHMEREIHHLCLLACLPVGHTCPPVRAAPASHGATASNGFQPPQARARRRTCFGHLGPGTAGTDSSDASPCCAARPAHAAAPWPENQGPNDRLTALTAPRSVLAWTGLPDLLSERLWLDFGSPGLAEDVSGGRQRRRHPGDLNKSKQSPSKRAKRAREERPPSAKARAAVETPAEPTCKEE